MGDPSTPITELNNQTTAGLADAGALPFIRTLRQSDASLFQGFGGYEGLRDAGPVAAAERAAAACAEVLRRGGVVVMAGCGTSGRVAQLVAREHAAREARGRDAFSRAPASNLLASVLFFSVWRRGYAAETSRVAAAAATRIVRGVAGQDPESRRG